jgi:hypothetical protein
MKSLILDCSEAHGVVEFEDICCVADEYNMFSQRASFILILILFINILIGIICIYSIDREVHTEANGKLFINSNNNNNDKNIQQLNNKLNQLLQELSAVKQELINQTQWNELNSYPNNNNAIKPYLIIGIPTVSRSSGVSYLSATLDSILEQLPSESTHPFYNRVVIAVQNNNAPNEMNEAFTAAQQLYSQHPCNCVKFHSNDGTLNKEAAEQLSDSGNANVPGPRVRKQTRDIVSLTHHYVGLSNYYLFMEDDFQLCADGLEIIVHNINKANHYFNYSWVSLRMSFGMNGFLVSNHNPHFPHSNDLQFFSQYLLRHQARRPPDHLIAEFAGAETEEARKYRQGRLSIVFKYNLMHHLGSYKTQLIQPSQQISKISFLTILLLFYLYMCI